MPQKNGVPESSTAGHHLSGFSRRKGKKVTDAKGKKFVVVWDGTVDLTKKKKKVEIPALPIREQTLLGGKMKGGLTDEEAVVHFMASRKR